MIVFYDILMLDERSLLDKTAWKGSSARETYQMCTWTLRYSSPTSHRFRPTLSVLRAETNVCQYSVARQEGLVLKADDPYFSFGALGGALAHAPSSSRRVPNRFWGCGDFGKNSPI